MICVAAIMGTVVIGYASTVYESTEYVTEYTYITDITGIFETERSPTYIEYSPGDNWTGYYTDDEDSTDGISYTESKTANSYVVHQTQDWSDYNEGDAYALSTDLTQYHDASYTTVMLTTTGTSYIYSADDGTKYMTAFFGVYNCSLAVLLEAMELTDIDETGYVRIYGYTGDITYQDVAIDSSTTSKSVTISPIIARAADCVTYGYNSVGLGCLYSADTAVAYADIQIADGLVTAYSSEGEVLWQASWSETALFYATGAATTYNYIDGTLEGTESAPYITPIYMNIQDGVSLSSSPVTWSNGYETSKIQILMVRPDKTSEFQTTWTFTLGSLVFDEDVKPYGQWNYEEGSDVVQITAYSDAGQTLIYVYENGVEVASYDLTSWSRWIVEYDAVDGVVYLTPLTTYNSMVSYSEYKTITLATLSVSGVFDDAVVTW